MIFIFLIEIAKYPKNRALNDQAFIHSIVCINLSTSTVQPDLIVTEMLAFPSKSSRNKNDSDPINGKTTPIQCIMGKISIVNSTIAIILYRYFCSC